LAITIDLVTPEGMEPFAGVSFVRLSVEAGGETLVEPKKSNFDAQGGSVSLDGIPFGEDRQIVVEGWSESATGDLGTLLSRGRSAPVDVSQGDSVVDLEVLVAPVNTFIPLTSKLDSTPQSLAQGRVGHTVTKTPRGEIVIVGGGILVSETSPWWDPASAEPSFATYHNSVEVLDETLQHVSLHPNGMYFGRAWHSATSLPTGQVFLAGGYTNLNGVEQALKRVEVYHPGLTNPIDVIKFDMQVPRWGHTATLVDEDSFTLLFVGGDAAGSGQGTYELWNPYVGTINFGELPDATLRRHHQATLFEVPDRGPAVLISGGESAVSTLDTMLVYDILTNTMLVNPGKLSAPRVQHASVWVPGRNFIYLAGGFTNKTRTAVSNAIDVYDTGKDTVQAMPGFNLKTPRGGHAAARAFGNSVVFTGGTGQGSQALSSLEVIYEYLDTDQGSYRIEVAESNGEGAAGIPFIPSARTGSRSVFTDGGMILTLGGVGSGAVLPTDVLLYNPF
jgi:hypothetical protein